MKDGVFQIPSCNLSTLNMKIEKLNRVAKKLNVPPITSKVLGFQKSFRTDPATGVRQSVTYYQVVIEGEAPKLAGWQFLATLEHAEAGVIIRAMPSAVVPDTFRTISKFCDHCKTTRRRNDTFLVFNGTDYLQIGRNCLKDFLGHSDPKWIAKLSEFIKELSTGFDEGGSPREKEVFHLHHFVSICAELTLTTGFVPRSLSLTTGITPTSSKAMNQFLRPNLRDKDWEEITPSVQALSLTDKAIAWAKTLITNPNQFLYNLGVAASEEYLDRKRAGILACLPATYQREVAKEEVKRLKLQFDSQSKHFGVVGERQKFELTVENRIAMPSNFSNSACLFKMKDAQGNIALWFTSQSEWEAPKIEVGKTYLLRATVKEHSEYKGIKQTKLSRCEVELGILKG